MCLYDGEADIFTDFAKGRLLLSNLGDQAAGGDGPERRAG